jgi:hypothetical protein
MSAIDEVDVPREGDLRSHAALVEAGFTRLGRSSR